MRVLNLLTLKKQSHFYPLLYKASRGDGLRPEGMVFKPTLNPCVGAIIWPCEYWVPADDIYAEEAQIDEGYAVDEELDIAIKLSQGGFEGPAAAIFSHFSEEDLREIFEAYQEIMQELEAEQKSAGRPRTALDDMAFFKRFWMSGDIITIPNIMAGGLFSFTALSQAIKQTPMVKEVFIEGGLLENELTSFTERITEKDLIRAKNAHAVQIEPHELLEQKQHEIQYVMDMDKQAAQDLILRTAQDISGQGDLKLAELQDSEELTLKIVAELDKDKLEAMSLAREVTDIAKSAGISEASAQSVENQRPMDSPDLVPSNFSLDLTKK